MTIDEIHKFRQSIDECIQYAEKDLNPSALQKPYVREMSLVRTKLQEAKMWAGQCLAKLGSELPAEFQDKADGV